MYTLNEIFTISDLAKAIEINEMQLRNYLKDSIEQYYSCFCIPKKDGSFRQIWAPKSELKDIQKSINKLLYYHYYTFLKKGNNLSHAFIKDRSIISNAKNHCNKKLVICIDIKDFFNTINFGRVLGFLRKNKNFQLTKEVSFAISKLACCNNVLPQGSPISPTLSNMITQCLDYYVMPIAKKFKCYYTRYADDMIFSTNDMKLKKCYVDFCECIYASIKRAGFEPNINKTRIIYNNSCQKVTGLIVNKKISVKSDYNKKTRAMCNNYFRTGEFHIDGRKGIENQLLGRLAFINQIDKYNNNLPSNHKQRNCYTLNSREKIYRDYLFFEKFYNNKNPIIVTEGKTDIRYLKAAIKKSSIAPNEFGRQQCYSFKFDELKNSKVLEYFLGINFDGGSKMEKIYSYFNPRNKQINLETIFDNKKYQKNKNPLILILDNENQNDKPLVQFKKKGLINSKQIDELEKLFYTKLETRGKIIYLVIIPKLEKKDYEIEDLFDKKTLETKIGGRTFSRKDEDKNLYYNKDIFSNYIYRHYAKISFSGFKKLLDIIEFIIQSSIVC